MQYSVPKKKGQVAVQVLSNPTKAKRAIMTSAISSGNQASPAASVLDCIDPSEACKVVILFSQIETLAPSLVIQNEPSVTVVSCHPNQAAFKQLSVTHKTWLL